MIRQLGWTEPARHGVRWSKSPYWKRFSIVQTSSGWTVCDHTSGELVRLTTKAAAKAWAGIRVGEQDVRHGA
jgi:hypothetical protein